MIACLAAMQGERTSVASGVDASLYPVAVLIDELRHDDMQLRLNSIKNLSTIALALGQERTREELIPFLSEIIDDDDEVLIALAEQLRNGVSWVGGPMCAHTLTGPLEELCNVEEISVRESATAALQYLAEEMSAEQVSRHFCGVIARLAAHDWFTSRISVCSLFAAALPKVEKAQQDDLLKTFFRLCGDDTPMVRRQAANVLGSVAQAIDQEPMEELISAFEKLSKDEQDSVRILAINNCIALGRLTTSAAWEERILSIAKLCAEDRSWRVRYTMADSVKPLLEVFKDKASTGVVPLYMKLLSDPEVEVRMIAAARIAAVAAVNPTKEFLETLVPQMEKLTNPRQHSEHVRASLAASVLGLTPIFGAKLTVEYLIKVFLQLIGDESPEVRLKVIGTLGELSSVVGLDPLSQSLLPAIKELGKDRQWRVRLAVIDCMPSLAQCLGEAEFTKELSGLFMVWLADSVFSVRDAAATSLRRLTEVLGPAWSEVNIIPQLQSLMAHKNYLYRISVMLCAGNLAEAGTTQFIEKNLVPMIMKMANDPVPNVRFNSAKTIQVMLKAPAARTVTQTTLTPCLQRLVTDDDPDVKFFAQRAMSN